MGPRAETQMGRKGNRQLSSRGWIGGGETCGFRGFGQGTVGADEEKRCGIVEPHLDREGSGELNRVVAANAVSGNEECGAAHDGLRRLDEYVGRIAAHEVRCHVRPETTRCLL